MRERAEVLDELLVLRCQGGDEHALNLLYLRWQRPVLARALGTTRDPDAAHDVAQDVWIAVARQIGGLRDPARFPSWILRMTMNKSRDWVRREQARRRTRSRLARERGPKSGPAPDASSDRQEAIERIVRALQALPLDRRTLLARFYLEEWSVKEISAALSIPEGTVKSRLHAAREALRISLEETP